MYFEFIYIYMFLCFISLYHDTHEESFQSKFPLAIHCNFFFFFHIYLAFSLPILCLVHLSWRRMSEKKVLFCLVF